MKPSNYIVCSAAYAPGVLFVERKGPRKWALRYEGPDRSGGAVYTSKTQALTYFAQALGMDGYNRNHEASK